MALKAHPLAEIFPLMSGAEFDALAADIKQHGLREKIVLHEGMILDGRNRYAACLDAGVQPEFQEWSGEGSIEAYVVSKNLHRRHLNETQRSVIAAKIANIKVGQVSGGKPRTGTEISVAEAAALLNVHHTSVTAARKVLTEGTPEEITAVEKGESAVSTTAKKIRERAVKEKSAPVAAREAPAPQQRIRAAEGMTLEEFCRRGLDLESQGLASDEVAGRLNTASSTYRKMREVVLLNDNANLSDRDRAVVAAALAEMNETASVLSPHKAVEPIAARVWGDGKRGATPQQSEARRLSNFERGFGVIIQACQCARDLDIPYFSASRAEEVLGEIKSAERNLRELRASIERIHA